jgi:hypothetical protein
MDHYGIEVGDLKIFSSSLRYWRMYLSHLVNIAY